MVGHNNSVKQRRGNAQYLASKRLGEPLYTSSQVSRMIKESVGRGYKLPGKAAIESEVRAGNFGIDISEFDGIEIDSANGDNRYQIRKSDLVKVVRVIDLGIDVDDLVTAACVLGFKT